MPCARHSRLYQGARYGVRYADPPVNGIAGHRVYELTRPYSKLPHAPFRTALFDFQPSRVFVNREPADLPKEGGRFELPLTPGIIAIPKPVPPASSKG